MTERFYGKFTTNKVNRVETCKKDKRNDIAIAGGTVDSVVNSPVNIKGIGCRDVVASIPVVLAQLNVQFNVTARIRLPEDALEIKSIKKRLKITQCTLLQNTNILFVQGFVRKNIDYSTASGCRNSEGVCGEIHHCTVDIPFEFTTPIEYNGLEPLDVVANTTEEFEYLRKESLPSDFAEKDHLQSGDLSEFNQVSTEYFNRLPYCEIISSRIVEFDEYINRRPLSGGPFEERVFNEIQEKMVINLVLRILQERQVEINE